MARPVPFNRYGIYGLETIDSVINDGKLVFVFEAHPYVNAPYNDLLLIRFKNSAPSGATGDMPIYFETRGVSGSRKAVTKAGGVPLLAEDISVPCMNLFYYNFNTGVIEALAGVINMGD